MAIYRAKHDKDNPYVLVDKKIVYDDRLSDSAKGLMLRILGRQDDWEFYTEKLSTECKDRHTSVKSSIKELIKYGYVDINRVRTENGQFSKSIFCVYEEGDLKNGTNNGTF